MAQAGSLANQSPNETSQTFGAARERERWSDALWLGLGALGLFLLMHPYRGIDGDARLYVGRALADLDPSGIGRDLMFVHDGQSRFSVFPLLLRFLVGVLGPAQAALALSLTGLVAWFAAAVALASRLDAGRGRWLILSALLLLSACYGYPGVFRVGEALATPRTLAEAAVLASLAALLSGHFGRASIFALLGCLLHPIMGLAGLVVLALALVGSNRRWLLAIGVVTLGTVTGALFGLPLFDRLIQGIDPELSRILRMRSAELFPSFWPGAAWAPIWVQGASILVAGTCLALPARRILYATLAAGILGVGASALFGDHWPSLLIVQLQPWRLLWLTATAGAASFGLCIVVLRGTAGGQITILLLALGWVCASDLPIAASSSGLALGIHIAVLRGRIAPTRNLVLATAVLVGLVVLVQTAAEVAALAWLVTHRVEGAWIGLGIIRNFSFVVPLALLAGMAWTWASRQIVARLALGLALSLALAALWDERSATARQIETRTALPDLVHAVAARPGPVLWLDGEAEAWLVLGRPNWITNLQGAGIVFSRPLALAWDARIGRMIGSGLASEIDRAPFHPPGPRRPDAPPASALAELCAAPDAPAWIVVPLTEGQALPGHHGIFRLPAPVTKLVAVPEGLAWRRIVAEGLLTCGA